MEWVVTDNIYRETWRRLDEFSNTEFSTSAISSMHGNANTSSLRSNYKKQAEQIRACIKQAQEYFNAASTSTLYTSPNHLYYGAVALSCAIMLLRGDGKMSLDNLRKVQSNNHHGLDFTIGCNSANSDKHVVLLEQCRVEILKNGHFKNWYSTLQKNIICYANVKVLLSDSINSSRLPVGQQFASSFDRLQGKKFNIIDLMSLLPDLQHDLSRSNISSPHTRSTLSVEVDTDKNTHFTWALHDCGSIERKQKILNNFEFRSDYAQLVNIIDTHNDTGQIIKISTPYSSFNEITFRFPDARETMSHESIMFHQNIDRLEIVDFYLLIYQLSMLSRYFPDIWVKCIESQCLAAKLIEHTINLIIKKFPILALSALYDTEVIITTHRMERT